MKSVTNRLASIFKSRHAQSSRARRSSSVTLGVEALESRLVPTTLANIASISNINQIVFILPGSQQWFNANMQDPGMKSLAAADFAAHGALTYGDMVGIFTQVESQGAITSAEMHDMQFLNANAGTLNMRADVAFETNEVVSITAFVDGFFGSSAAGSYLPGLVDKWFLGEDHPAAATAYSNVGGSLFGGGVSYLQVQQGQVGDCWLLASLAETAARRPWVIQNMFTYDGTTVENGTTVSIWSVRFFENGVAKYVTVDSELPGGGSYYDHPSNGALWVSLAEKAYAEANGDGFVTTGSSGSDSYAALNDGWPSWALPAINGGSAAEYSVNPTNIVQAWNAGELIVLCTSNPASTDIVASHCYALVNYDSSSGLPFEIYNPWGTTSTGYAPYTYNGHQVYGLFICNAPFISQNFAEQSLGSAAVTSADHGTTAFFAGHQNEPAPTGSAAEFVDVDAVHRTHLDAAFADDLLLVV